ncbi:hypothetical protein CLV98_104370 [Dyadobacter jejuensis]|uniref:Uncharacterized protein n=1 Tax=Dyadobacter jejuensis TaxID=1082580 RepID=A0A316ANY5_9BACT|nr:hypothetical protein [Dyadobacter jejuensis]PWJ58510.1 hypothetical protein CLV98_104370 [Dyadobacter jejuensis]
MSIFRRLIVGIVLLCVLGSYVVGQASFNKLAYYEVLSGPRVQDMQKMLNTLGASKGLTHKDAYRGALLMKQADFEKTVGAKLKMFKQGRALLEAAIAGHPQEVELRFLRLTVQEHAPAILKYNKNIDEDAKVISSGFSSLDRSMQSIIMDYADQTKQLNKAELRP